MHHIPIHTLDSNTKVVFCKGRLIKLDNTPAAMTPSAKTGKMRKDKYWVLKSDDTTHFTPKGQSYGRVEAERIDLAMYRLYADEDVQTELARKGERIHGRRINDEVELFPWKNGKEAPGLRQSLEEKGLKVRLHAPEATHKFPKPNYNTIMGRKKDGEPKTPLEKCIEATRLAVQNLEKDEKTSIDYAVLADGGVTNDGKGKGKASSKKNKRVILVCKLRPQDLHALHFDDNVQQKITANDVEYRVLGWIVNGVPRFKTLDEFTLSFFEPYNDETQFRVSLCFLNVARQREEAEQEAAKKAKKEKKRQEQKHRRQLTTSSAAETLGTSGSGSSSGSGGSNPSVIGDEVDGAARARKREKANAKRKAQKERKRAASGKTGSNGGDGSEASSATPDEKMRRRLKLKATRSTILGRGGQGVTIFDLTGISRRTPSRGGEDEDKDEGAHTPGSTATGSSVSRVIELDDDDDDQGEVGVENNKDGEDDTGMNVVCVQDREELARVVEEAEGPVMCVDSASVGLE